MRKLLLILFLFPLLTLAQEKGIRFEHNTNWDAVKAKAKLESKYIFVDCFTTWCGPCAYMSQNIFPQEKVGDFFNDKFVNLKIQMDQTAKDNDDVKSWYDEAKRFTKDYDVNAYPTFLIFAPSGELVHRIVGGGEADDFIAKAQLGLNPETQYYTVVKNFIDNPNDAQIAYNTISAATGAFDRKLMDQAIARYIQLEGPDALLTTENVGLILPYVSSTKSPIFALFSANIDKVDLLLAELNAPFTVNDVLASAIIADVVVPQVYDESVATLDFDVLQKQLNKDFPTIDVSKSLLHSKGDYYVAKKNWPAFKDVVNEIVRTQGKDVTPAMLNQFAWEIFENCDDTACLQAALAWSKKSLEPEELAAYIDTYANLLYKTGDTKNAIAWQEKAVQSASENDKQGFTETLEKMKSGKATWN